MKVYKARYFSASNFLEAELSYNSHFIWRSIWEVKDLIKAGVRWRIELGHRVNIIGQPWFLDDINPYITTVTQALENNKVVSLMCVDKREWDLEVLRDIFNDRDQNCILNIPLSEFSRVYILYWSKENSGIYSVRSEYKFLQAQRGQWNILDNDSIWRKMWRIKAPPKALNTVWRAFSSCLPTLTKLRHKQVPVQRVCPVCLFDQGNNSARINMVLVFFTGLDGFIATQSDRCGK